MMKKGFKIIKWIFCVLFVVVAILIIWNFICKRTEQSKIEAAYGNTVEINGHDIVISIEEKKMKQQSYYYPAGVLHHQY